MAAMSSSISSSHLLPRNHLCIYPQIQQLFLFKNSNPITRNSNKKASFKIQATKLPAGVELPKVEPKLQPPFLGFTRTAEIWNSRACMIGLIGTFIVELVSFLFGSSFPFLVKLSAWRFSENLIIGSSWIRERSLHYAKIYNL